MVRIFGGCIINSQTLSADLLLSDKCVDDFHISDTEITNFQYNQFLLATGNTAKTGAKQQPVVNVSWQEAVDFTKWLSKKHQKNYTLPNSTQWQYAANTDGNSTKQEICNQANAYSCGNNASQSAQNVKSLAPNKWALYDMYGNVWEWIWAEAESEKTVKGGSWRSFDDIFNLNQQSAPAEKSADIGFRIVSD
ncbi:MAG: formylglycine-generating enzyme family protein [Candidatus Thioglobus sp.]|nr:formylglycine-generating enzyme family protein [Candidatus Thioglobus sp.]